MFYICLTFKICLYKIIVVYKGEMDKTIENKLILTKQFCLKQRKLI